MTGFVENSNNQSSGFSRDEKFYFIHVAAVVTCFESEKSQNELYSMQHSQKCLSKVVAFILIGVKEKNIQPHQYSVLALPESLRMHSLTACEALRYETFSKQLCKLPQKCAVMNKSPVQI